ncbi:MAG: hypothetical protein NVS9B1_06660 [Candidatus Dormibacteraceae bacterium]
MGLAENPIELQFEDRPVRVGTRAGGPVVLRDGREAELRVVELAGPGAGPGWVDRLRRLAAVRQPSLLPIAGGRAEGGLGIVYLEPARGISLDDLLERSGPLSPAQGVAVGMALFSALEALQRAGFGHGRLSAADVNVAPWGQVRLTGYGIATAADPRADVAAAGRTLCDALGIDPTRAPGDPQSQVERALPGLAATLLTIARGGAGRSASTALMMLTDGAGRLAGRGRLYLSTAELGRLAAPAPALTAAIDSLMVPVARRRALTLPRMTLPRFPFLTLPHLTLPRIQVPPLLRLDLERSARWLGPLAVGTGLLLLAVAVVPAALHPRAGARPAPAPVARAAGLSDPSPAIAVPAVASPDVVVGQFYQLVLQRRFDAAADLWSDNMRANFPPQTNLTARFAETTVLKVNRAAITSQDSQTAIVATDLSEVTSGFDHHWIGTWRLVRGANGWLLDQPDFQSV